MVEEGGRNNQTKPRPGLQWVGIGVEGSTERCAAASRCDGEAAARGTRADGSGGTAVCVGAGW